MEGALPKLRQTFNKSVFKRDSSIAGSTRRSIYKPLAFKDENSTVQNWTEIPKQNPFYV